jgi:hypothetical protein
MADKGFNIQDLLAVRNARLMAPPIMAKNKESACASTATRRVARARVHVECMIKKLKCYRVNMQPSLIRFEDD